MIVCSLIMTLGYQMNDELKRCPFCGGEAKLCEVNSNHWVNCVNLECDGATICCRNKEEAIAAWNKRVQEVSQ